VLCTEPFIFVAHPCHILNSRDITGLTISVQKTKLMALTGRDPVRSKIVIDNKITEQVNSFNYLRNLLSYEKKIDTDSKLNKYLKIAGIINSMFRPQKTLKKTRIELHSTLAFPALSHGSGNWTIKTRDARRIKAAQMKYAKKKKQNTLGQIIKQTQIKTSIQPHSGDKIQEYSRNWLQQLNRVPLIDYREY